MGVKIKGIELFNGENSVDNKFYADYYSKLGIDDISHIEKGFEIQSRYVKNSNTTMLDMCTGAAEKVLHNNGLTGEDIDFLILATVTPEYSVPPTSAKLLANIGSKPTTAFYDVDAACSGILHALKQGYSLLNLDKKLNRILIVGYDDVNAMIDKENPLLYGCYGDTAVGLILERVEGETSGYIDSMHHSDVSYSDHVKFPPHGNTVDILKPLAEKYLYYNPEFAPYHTPDMLRKLLQDNNLDVNEIKAFGVTQSGTGLIHLLEKEFNLAPGTVAFYGTTYGYTSTACVMVALYEQIKERNIKTGDLICFCGVGIGFQELTMLIRF